MAEAKDPPGPCAAASWWKNWTIPFPVTKLSARPETLFSETVPPTPVRRHPVIPRTPVLFFLLCFTPTWPGATDAGGGEPKPIPGVGPVGKITKLHTGFKFTEGPAADKAGNVYFSDIPAEKIHKVDADGKLSVFSAKSKKANGLMVNAQGEIVACEMTGHVVALSPDGKEGRVLADQYDGKPFNAPNDLVLDQQGGVYFTDPGFGAKTPLPQGKTCVYYIAPGGKVTRL